MIFKNVIDYCYQHLYFIFMQIGLEKLIDQLVMLIILWVNILGVEDHAPPFTPLLFLHHVSKLPSIKAQCTHFFKNILSASLLSTFLKSGNFLEDRSDFLHSGNCLRQVTYRWWTSRPDRARLEERIPEHNIESQTAQNKRPYSSFIW